MQADRTLSQFMAHVKVHLLEAHRSRVSSSWGETQPKNDYAKLYLILSGEGYISVDEKVYYPQAGEMIYIPCGHRIRFGTKGPKYFEKYWCHFRADIGSSSLYELMDFPLLVQVKEQDSMRGCFERMCQAYHAKDPLSPMKANADLMLLIYYFLGELGPDHLSLRHQASSLKMNQLLAYMDKSIDQKLTIEDLADVANLHPNYLIRYFKATFGTTPIAYFNRLKMDRAKELLSIQEASIKNIASSLGFSTPYYFSSTFKKHTGFTPSSYRKYRFYQNQ